MKRVLAIVVSLALAAPLAAVSLRPARAADEPGLALFKNNGCNECHAISALAVERDAKKKSAAESEADKEKKEAPDLSGVGLERAAKWISDYLAKEADIDGEKHEKRFKGSTSDRRTIALWLATLKTEVKKAPADKASEAAGDEKAKGESKDDGE